MLAALVLRANQVVPADALVEAIWDGQAPDTAASVLRLLRHRDPARPARSPAPHAQPSGYQLVVEPGEIDAIRFEGLLTDGRRALAEGYARLARALCQRGLALWRGPALLDLTSLPFARDEGARLDELRLACLETRLDAELRLGRHAEALSELEGLVAEHPLRERLRALLVLALYRSGRQADALASHATGGDVLVEELGLEPGPELRDLRRGSCPMTVARPAVPDRGPAALVPAPPTPTIGRERALAAVRAGAARPGGRLVTLVGPGGIGKTRLGLETARRSAASSPTARSSWSSPPRRAGPAAARHRPRARACASADAVGDQLVEHLAGARAAAGARQPRAPRGRRRPAPGAARRRRRASTCSRRAGACCGSPPSGWSRSRRSTAAPRSSSSAARRRRSVGGGDRRRPGRARAALRAARGPPLAIELAAPWLRTLPPAELSSGSSTRLEVMRRGRRDAPERHRTMRAAIGWSVDLLEPGAAVSCSGALAVFSGGFATDAALAVGDGATVEQLDALVDASVVHSRGGRHRLLEVVREYASELPAADEGARARHAAPLRRAGRARRARADERRPGPLVRAARARARQPARRARLAAGTADPAPRAAAGRLAGALLVRTRVCRRGPRAAAGRGRASPDAPATRRRSEGPSRGLRPRAPTGRLRAGPVPRRAGAARSPARSERPARGAQPEQPRSDPARPGRARAGRRARSTRHRRRPSARRRASRRPGQQQPRRRRAHAGRPRDGRGAQFEQSLAILRAEDDVANVARALFNLGAVAAEQGRTTTPGPARREHRAVRAVDDSEDVAWCLIALAAVGPKRAARWRDAALLVGPRGAARPPRSVDEAVRARPPRADARAPRGRDGAGRTRRGPVGGEPSPHGLGGAARSKRRRSGRLVETPLQFQVPVKATPFFPGTTPCARSTRLEQVRADQLVPARESLVTEPVCEPSTVRSMYASPAFPLTPSTSVPTDRNRVLPFVSQNPWWNV